MYTLKPETVPMTGQELMNYWGECHERLEAAKAEWHEAADLMGKFVGGCGGEVIIGDRIVTLVQDNIHHPIYRKKMVDATNFRRETGG